MVKRATKKRRTQAGAEERYMQKVDRAVARYGASAVAKYFAPPVRRMAKETGYVDLAYASYACDTTGSITLLATVPQNTSVNGRVGKKIMWKSIQGRGIIAAGSTATLNDTAWIIVYDKRPTGSLPAITEILDTANSRSMNLDANAGRFVILKRKDYMLTGNSATPATGREAASIDFYMKVNRPAVFKAAGTGQIGDIEEGALYLVTVGNIVAGTAAAALGAGFRVRYIDH